MKRPSPTFLRQVAVAGAVFTAWTVSSLLCHELAKTFLQNSEQNFISSSSLHTDQQLPLYRFVFALFLTLVQSISCFLLVRSEPSLGSRTLSHPRTWTMLIVTHVLATFATNYSMAYIEASSTLAIKLTEPITMAAAHHILYRTAVPLQTAISMPLIICGALVFTGLNVQEFSDSTGASLAFASNIILAARNITLKKFQKDSSDISIVALRPKLHIFLTFLFQIIFVATLYFLEIQSYIPRKCSLLFALSLLSGVFHVTYSYISTNIVLKVMNVISHSIANIFKRFLVVLLLCALGNRYVSVINVMGLAVAICGLLIYTHGKTQTSIQSKENVQDSGRHETFGSKLCLYLLVLVLLTAVTLLVIDKSNVQVNSKSRFDNLDFDIYRDSHGLEITDCPYKLFSCIEKVETNPEMREFLSWRLVDHPEDTDKRAKTLTRSRDIVEEAQRILMNLLQDLLGKAKHVMLIEIATYSNKGDPAITVGEVMLLRRMNINIVFYCETNTCIKNTSVNNAVEINTNYGKDELVILMQGGGNLVGYPFIDVVRKKYIETFPDRRILLFSQSIWLRSKKTQSLNFGRHIYSNRSNLVMFMRDRQSLEIAKANFKGVKFILAPDMAFCIGMVPRQMPPSYDIVWLKRNDSESSNYVLPSFPENITVTVADWLKWTSNRGRTDMETSFLVAAAGFQFLQRGRIVITDRLHGHILSTLMNIPHVLIDNPPHLKLSSFDKSWTKSLSNTIFVTNGSLALDAARELLKRYHNSLPSVGPKDMYIVPKT